MKNYNEEITATDFIKEKIKNQRKIKGHVAALVTYSINARDAAIWMNEFNSISPNHINPEDKKKYTLLIDVAKELWRDERRVKAIRIISIILDFNLIKSKQFCEKHFNN